MNLGFGDFAVLTAIWAVLQVFLYEFFKTHMTSSINHDYDKKLEEFKNETRKREQAAQIAKVLACACEPDVQSREFNELAWELFLWLPKDLAMETTLTLCHREGAKPLKELLVEVRKILIGKDDDFKWEDIPHKVPVGRNEVTIEPTN